jgi:hypothetical protein
MIDLLKQPQEKQKIKEIKRQCVVCSCRNARAWDLELRSLCEMTYGARRICFGRRPADAFCRGDREPNQMLMDDTTTSDLAEELSGSHARRHTAQKKKRYGC